MELKLSHNNRALAKGRIAGVVLLSLMTLSYVLTSNEVSAKGAVKGSTATKEQPPAQQATCTIPFTDVQSTDYFYPGIQYLYCMGALGGYRDGTFRPYAGASRGQISKIISIAQGWTLVNPPAATFPDVPVGSTFFSYVETAKLHNVIAGRSDGLFHPGDSVSRGQLAKIISLSQGWTLEAPAVSTFADVGVGDPFFTYVETAYMHEAISGYADGLFRTGELATRGQISKAIHLGATAAQLTQQEQDTLDIINSRRMSMGLNKLRINNSLTESARRQSNDVGPQGLCQHSGTDGSSPWDRIAQAGYTGFGAGETIACSFNSASSAVDAWWADPPHYAILTDPAINEIGVGWWVGANGYGWVTCDTGQSAP